MQLYELDKLVKPNLDASEEHIVAFTDIALDCVKTPGTRRPEMRDVVRRMASLLAEMKGGSGGNEDVPAEPSGALKGRFQMAELLDELENEYKLPAANGKALKKTGSKSQGTI